MSISTYYRNQVKQGVEQSVTQTYPNLLFYGAAPILKMNGSHSKYQEKTDVEFYTESGHATFVAGCANDLPTVSIFKQKRSFKFTTIGNKIDACVEDLERMEALGVSDIPQKTALAQKIVLTTADKLAVYGSTAREIYGMLGQPNAYIFSLPNDGVQNVSGNNPSPRLIDKTDVQLLRDLFVIAYRIPYVTNNVFYHDKMLVTSELYDRMASTVVAGITTGETILSFFLKVQKDNPLGIKSIQKLPHLKGEGSLPNSDLLVTFNSNDPDLEFNFKDGIDIQTYDCGRCMETDFKHSLSSVISKTPYSIAYVTV